MFARLEPELPATACPDWAMRLSRGEMPMATELLPLETPEAERFSKIFRRLRVSDLNGKPCVGDLENHGWIDTFGRALWGGPTIREGVLSTAKKQSKTSFGSLLFLAALLAERTPRQSFTVVGPTREIAAHSFDMIEGAISADKTLRRITHVRQYVREIEHRRTGARLKVSAFTKGGVTGLKGNIYLDEVAVLGSSHLGQGLRAQIKGALAANKRAKVLYITTTDENPPQGLWLSLVNYCRLVRSGKIADPTFLPCIYEPPKGVDPWSDPDWWARLLPSYGATVDEAFLKSVIAEAEASGPAAVARDKAQFFNVEQSVWGGGLHGWKLAELYGEISTPRALSEIIATCSALCVGIDLGGLDDLAALTVLGVKDDKWMLWTHAWAMESAWEANTDSRSKFDDFVTAGDLEKVEIGADLEAMVEICLRCEALGKLKGVGIDPAGARQLVEALVESEKFVLQDEEDEYPPGFVPIVGVSQSALQMNSPRLTLERKAAAGEVEIAESGLVSWALGNVVLKRYGAAIGIDRAIQGAKIDPVAAMLDAVAVELAGLPLPGFDPGSFIG